MKRYRGGFVGPLLVLPMVVVYAMVTVAPLFYVIRMSLYESTYITERWVGLGNYVETFRDPAWWRSLWVTARFVICIVPLEVLIPLAIALYLATERKRTRTFVLSAFHLPAVISATIMATVWGWVFARRGLANAVLGVVGLKVDWFADQWTATAAISAMIVSVSMGGALVMYMALLQGADPNLVEAAKIDGASCWQIRWRVLAPMLYPTAALFTLLAVIAAAQVWFLPYLFTSGGPGHMTETLMFDVYLQGFWLSRYGMANARSVVLTLVIMALALLHRRLSR